ncbi:hypothetical protein BDV23DRAFT_176240 [Aspergillus alliaceus]|uniref:Uncharacterized protein n=1 Tax=Petromyces alliaceus TaxID=209559 RepID=A0A5N7BUC5_PETAA|nr:hypothetical protein BDV23DRAFT_176240 [Aspergillus alliaceus]
MKSPLIRNKGSLPTSSFEMSSFSRIATAKAVGYFESSDCVDPLGLESCYKKAEQSLASYINNSCAGREQRMRRFMRVQALEIDCIHVCECVQYIDHIDCAATSCWNQNNDWGQCGTSLEGVNCPADLEFTNQTKYHTPGKLPVNGTESLYNTGGVISTPVSGNISIWTMRDVLYPITAAATNKAVPTKSESGDKGATTTSAESKAGYQLGMSLWVTVGAISTAFLAIAI